MERTLRDFKVGEKGIVKKIKLTGAIRRRLLDMGITPGTEIILQKVAPLGDPLEIKVRGYELSLRKAEAEIIVMASESGWKK